MQKEEQSSRQIVMCHLMATMGIDIEKAKNIVSEMEERKDSFNLMSWRMLVY